MTITCAVVILLFVLTLLKIGLSLSTLKQDIEQIKEKTLPYILIVDEIDLNRADVQQFLTDVSATHDRDGYKDAEESAKHFLGGVEKFKQMYRRACSGYGWSRSSCINDGQSRPINMRIAGVTRVC